jgi:hypothetical protein
VNSTPKPSDSILFPLSVLDRAIADVVAVMPQPAKWPAFNSLRHLNRAWKLRGIDEDMALFRAITAEEEASSALFLSLKRRGYRGADMLKRTRHDHKSAVVPFMKAIAHTMSSYAASVAEMQLHLDPEYKPPRLVFRFRFVDPKSGKQLWGYPQPPLNFLSSRKSLEQQFVEEFREGVEAIVNSSSAKDLIAFVKDRADFRNRILYAKDHGYIDISFDFDRMFSEYQKNVFMVLKAYLMIDPYREKQQFVQQALDAFLLHLKSIPRDE